MKNVDVEISGGGSVYLFRPLTPRAKEFLRDNTDPEAPWLGNALAVEHRYVIDLIRGLLDHEFTVSR